MDETTAGLLSVVIIMAALFITAGLSRRRKNPFTFRRIKAYEAIPQFVGQSVESDRPLHISLGSSGIGGETTLLSVASAEFASLVAYDAVLGDTSPIVTVSNSSALPIGQDSLRRAYQSRDLSERYKSSNVRWYPEGSRSLAFAAAISAMISEDKVAGSVMAGSHGSELALIMEASHRNRSPIIAVSNQLEGQAVAYALSDEALIGEEVFAAASYLGSKAGFSTDSVTIDVLRWLLILILLVGLILNIINNGG